MIMRHFTYSIVLFLLIPGIYFAVSNKNFTALYAKKKPVTEKVVFRAKVMDISACFVEIKDRTQLLTEPEKFTGRNKDTRFVIDEKPRWTMSLKVISVKKSNVLEVGETLNFQLNSPAKFFNENQKNIRGKEYNFKLEIKHLENGKLGLSLFLK